MRYTLLLALAGAAFATSAFAVRTPPRGTVTIVGVRYNGDGCAQGTVAQQLAEDLGAFTLLFSDFVVSPIGANESASRYCTLDLDMRVPAGWAMSLFSLDARGFLDLKVGARGVETTTVSFPGTASRQIGRMERAGPTTEDYFNRTTLPVTNMLWSTCDGDVRTMQLKTTVTVNGHGLMTVDSVDGSAAQLYGVRWRQCSLPTPPPTHPVYRLFLSAGMNSDHLHSTVSNEGSGSGYRLEGKAFSLFDSPQAGTAPLFRCISAGTGHFLTNDANCEALHKPAEGVLGHVASSPQPGMVGLVRCRKTASAQRTFFLSTTSSEECVAAGYTVDGPQGYVFP